MRLSTKTVSDILERWAEEGIVTDHCAEYGEPGYSFGYVDADLADHYTSCVVLGNFWCQCGKVTEETNDKPVLHGYDHHHPRLWAQLEAQGVSFEWYDEWTIDYETDKAYRTSPDSYSWKPSFVWTDSGDMLTADDDLDVWLEWATEGDQPKCLLSHIHTEQDLLDAGFEKHNGEFESGFHPDQTADPKTIMEQMRAAFSKHTAEFSRLVEALADTPVGWIETASRLSDAIRKVENLIGSDVDVVFMLDDVGQFDMTFSAYWRHNDLDEDDVAEGIEEYLDNEEDT